VPQLRASTLKMHQRLIILAIPCCIRQEFNARELEEINMETVHDELDWGIMSEKRRVLIWQSILKQEF